VKTGAKEGSVTKRVALLGDVPDQVRRLIIALFILSGLLLAVTPDYVLWTAWNRTEPASELPVDSDQALVKATVLDTAGTHISTVTTAEMGQVHFLLGMDDPALQLAPAQLARQSSLVELRWLGEQAGPTRPAQSSARCRSAASSVNTRCSVWVVHDDYGGALAATTGLGMPQAAHVYLFDKTLPSNMELALLPGTIVEIACGLLVLVFAYRHAPRVKAAMRMVGKSLGLIDTAPAVGHERGG
jgi:hypothetical protein